MKLRQNADGIVAEWVLNVPGIYQCDLSIATPTPGGITMPIAYQFDSVTIGAPSGIKAEAKTSPTINGHVPQLHVAGRVVWEGEVTKTQAKALKRAQQHLQDRVTELFA
jgi:hypothetical protein